MSTYNGEKYLREQIDSILSQKGVNVELFVRDDGSRDSTIDILSDYEKINKNIHVEQGANLGHTKSFIHALTSAPEFDYYAYSDQDDVWLDEKLISAVTLIKEKEFYHSKNVPVIWHCNYNFVDSNLNFIRAYRQEKRICSLESFALSQYGRGCAIVMNASVRKVLKNFQAFCMTHDNSLFPLVCASAGYIILDPHVYFLYRQHGNNVSKPPATLKDRIMLALKNVTKKSRYGTEYAKRILQVYGDKLPSDTRNNLILVAGYREHWLYRIKIILSPKFATGYFLRTLFGKIRILLGNL